MNFYGRTQERKKLHTMIHRNGHQVALIYGRRRVGKSELIKQSLRETKITSIYFECKETNQMNNVDSLSALIGETFDFPTPSFGSLEETLDFLYRKAQKEDLLLVLDEYPYVREVIPGIDSILQSLIDRYRDNSRLKLILCGSFVDTMKSLLMKENPLYGRVDLTIELKPMDYYDSSLFYEKFQEEDKVRLYSVFGGIPYYNRLIDPSISVKENIINLIASPGARLENEVSMYLKSEISRITNANEVFEALAKGYSRFSDILSQSHVSSSPTLSDVLEKLVRMEVVQKDAPINDPNNRRKTGYVITDNLSLFYYRYVFRFASQMSVMDPEIFYRRYIENDFEQYYVPHVFESISKQFLIRQNRRGRIEEPFGKIGKYYYADPVNRKNGEFDIVTQDPKGYMFYEVKFRKEPLTEQQIQKEIEQVKETGLDCYRYGFISRSGFACQPKENMVFIELKALFGYDED